MKRSSSIPVVLAAAALALAGPGALRATPATCPPDAPSPADKPGATHGLNPADMNPAVSACQDFNEYANGGWLKANPIPADQSYWGSFTILEETNRANLRKVLEKAAAAPAGANMPTSDERKVGDFWTSCMDEAAIESAGLTPLKPELARIDKIASVADLQAQIARLQAQGVNAGFRFASEQDRRKSTEVIAYAGQGGLGLPDRDYYLKDDEDSKTIREKYLAHVQRMFGLMGEDEKRAAADAKTVMDLEKRLAEASMTRVERRDPEATYNRKTSEDLAKLTPNFSWTAYFQAFGITPAAVNVAQPKFFEAFDKELRATPLDAWKTYLKWHTLSASAPLLSKAFVDENFDFYGKTLTGHAGERAALEALRERGRRRAGRRAREGLRQGLLPARGEGPRRRDGQEPDRRPTRRLEDASLDGRGDQAAGPPQARHVQSQDRLSRPVARLRRAQDRPRAVRAEHAARARSSSSSASSGRSASPSTAGLADDAARRSTPTTIRS